MVPVVVVGFFPVVEKIFIVSCAFAKLEIINKQQPDYRSQLKSVQSNKFSVDDVLKEKEGNEPEWAKK
ncbi:hypothetical protein T07_4320 [Trichinella nelsoni]|uniref:Uncharacterized protein n=2 Tax=Trichinella TaxID=6333 RepID=A0A0V0S1P6_9BILA|nr:hypothetical protein T07_4320 [Trichinella nelsoni]KRX37090.1 hypothetical protein T05_14444 [Trichinella murrelli]